MASGGAARVVGDDGGSSDVKEVFDACMRAHAVAETRAPLVSALVEWAAGGGELDVDDVFPLVRVACAERLRAYAAECGGIFKEAQLSAACRYWWRRYVAAQLRWTRRREEGATDGFPPRVDAALRALTAAEWRAPTLDAEWRESVGHAAEGA